MANWLNRLELKDLWEAQDKNKLTIQQVAGEVAKRIRAMKCYEQEKEILEIIADNFEFCSKDQEEFDEYLSELYDWGDQPVELNRIGFMRKKMCWINTIF